jgi:hypothetical protein
MEFQSKNYVTWDQYAQMHPEIGDIEGLKNSKYEDQIFSLVIRLFR